MAAEKNNKTLNVPNLRFPEFSEEWEKVPLSQIATRVTRKNKNNATRLPLTISAQHGLVDQVTFFNKVVASSDMSNYYLLHRGEFAYNKSYSGDYPWGAIKRLDRYDQGALSSLYICFAPTDIIDSDFLVHYFESPKWHREVSNIAGEGARNHGLLNIAVPDFFNTQHSITTNKKEQRKIADFLNLIDERIETQRRIIEDLKKLKRAICDKCFSNGSKVKFSDLGYFIRGLSYSTDEVQEYSKGTMVLRSNNIENGEDVNMDELVWVSKGLEDKQKLQYGDIVICMANGSSRLVGKASYFPKEHIYDATVGAFCGILRPLSPVAKWLVQTKTYRKYIHQAIQGGNGAIANIYPQDILNMTFCIPDNWNSVTDALELLHERIITESKILKAQLSMRQHLLFQIFI